MDTGWIVSLIVTSVLIFVILIIAFMMDRKYIVRERGRINYQKTKIFLRWNVFDTMSIALAIYAIICVQMLNYLVSSGLSINNVFVQFFTNQAQVWTFISISYLISRISMTIKSIKVRRGDYIE